MTKITVLGSTRFEPYEFLAVPNRILGGTNDDVGYAKACEIFYPAIDESDEIWVFCPDGIGIHTAKDIEYARKQGKIIRFIGEARWKT